MEIVKPPCWAIVTHKSGSWRKKGSHLPTAKMLVLSRKVGEKILIGDSISVTVVRISGGGVRIGIEAPAELPVVREELSTKTEAETEKSAVIHQDHVNSTNGNGSFDGETPKQPR